MIKNYIKVALRNLVKYKSYSFINIVGLAIGLACSILIAMFVFDELSYDKFHEKAYQIYRVSLHGRLADNEFDVPSTCGPLASTLVNDYPEVLQATRVLGKRSRLVNYEDKHFNEEEIIFADSNFFDVFTFPFIQGNPNTVLSQTNSIVITEKTAKKYFGNENPMDKLLRFDDDTTYFQITGIIKNLPNNSHFHFDFVVSFYGTDQLQDKMWGSNYLYTYIVLQKDFPPAQLENKFPALLEKYVGPEIEQFMGISFKEFLERGNKYGFALQPLLDIHLYSDLEGDIEPQGDITYVYIFSVVAVFILLIACINFMNLTTARSASRATEVGVRKVAGSSKSQLIGQFLYESILLSGLAFIFAIVIVSLSLPFFNNITGKEFSVSYFNDPIIILTLLGIAIIVGIIAGSYPAFVLASLKPVVVLKGKIAKGMKSGLLRSILVVFQFSISIIVFIATFIVYNQLFYIQNKKLGFEKEHVLVIHRVGALGNQKEAFKQDLLKYPDIISVTHSNTLPGRGLSFNGYQLEGDPEGKVYILGVYQVDFDFTETLKLEMAEGRFFSSKISSDSSAVIINETAVKNLGLKEPLGKRIIHPGETLEESEFNPIIGVVKDLNFQTLHLEIRPMIIELISESSGGFISVKIKPENIQSTINRVKHNWEDFVSKQPFEYSFLDEDFENLYEAEQRSGKVFIIFSILAIFIACLGLFGLVSLSVSQRTKEIGIRKVLGSSILKIFLLLSKENIKLVIIASIIACPIAYFFVINWLQNFYYRVSINPLIFIFTVVIISIIAIVTISYHAITAATKNPAESLRYE
jgi:putative ABC transport system permease protein